MFYAKNLVENCNLNLHSKEIKFLLKRREKKCLNEISVEFYSKLEIKEQEKIISYFYNNFLSISFSLHQYSLKVVTSFFKLSFVYKASG